MCEEEFRSEPLTRHLCLSHISSGRRRISGDLRVFQISGHRRKILRDSNDVQNTQSHLARMSLRLDKGEYFKLEFGHRSRTIGIGMGLW